MTPAPLLIGLLLSLSGEMAKAEESVERSRESKVATDGEGGGAGQGEAPSTPVGAPQGDPGSSADLSPKPSPPSSPAQNFGDYRDQILSTLSRASRRIWLVSSYVTDGDIVSGLYVAQYRKIDVRVLLGKARAHSYMSRLQYLKSQNIPVYLKPDSLVTSHPTVFLVDDVLIQGASDLDFMTRSRDFSIATGTDEARTRFEQEFGAAFAHKIPANAAPLPLVGRPGRSKGTSSAPSSAPSRAPLILAVPQAKHQDTPGVFHYRRQKDPRPSGVPARLPRGLKWEKRAAQEEPMIVPSAPRPAPHVGGG